MKKRTISTLAITACLMAFCGSAWTAERAAAEKKEPPQKNEMKADAKVVRACIIGGMTMTDLWPEIAKRFEKKTGLKIVLVDTGPRPQISVPFREGKADLLTMHSGDITTDLVADGYGINLRPWTRNDLVILGPPSDPAKIKGLKDGAEAFRRIAAAKVPFLDALDAGGREMSHKLWGKANIKPQGSWIIRDDSAQGYDIPAFASEHGSYVVFGRMPFLFSKVDFGNLQIMVEGDPDMRRPYMVMEANPARFPQANHRGAKLLSDFFFSTEIQTFLKEFGVKQYGMPLFYPVWPIGS